MQTLASRRTAVYGLAAIGVTGVGIAAIALALTGFLFGLIVIFGFLGFALMAVVGDRSFLTQAIRRPARREMLLFGSVFLLLGGAAAVALVVEGFVWVIVPLAGGLLVVTVYELSAPAEESPLVVTPEPAEVLEDRQVVPGVDSLREVDIFRGLSDRQLEAVAALGDIRVVREGAPLGIEGHVGRSLYVILRGQAELSANSAVGRVTARIAGPGESLPLASLLGDGTLITSIVARTPMTVWQVDRDRLISFFERDPGTAAAVYEVAATVLAERYRKTLWRLTTTTANVVKSDEFWVNV